MNPLLAPIKFSSTTLKMLELDSDFGQSDHMHLATNAAGNKFICRAYGVITYADGTRKESYPAVGSANDFFKATPGASIIRKKMSKPGVYALLHASDFSVFRIMYALPFERIHFADNHTKHLFYTIYGRFVAGEQNAVRLHEWKSAGKAPDFNGIERANMPLKAFQKVCAMNALTCSGFAPLMEQGTGKTPVSVVVMSTDCKRKRAAGGSYYRGMIVAPLNVKFNWEGEISKFSALTFKVKAIDGTQIERLTQMREVYTDDGKSDGGIAVMSYKTAADIVPLFELLGVTLDMLILDEAHKIKNPSAQITKAMLRMRDLAEKRLALTGTPIGNSVADLWAILEFLYPGCSGFVDFSGFKKFYLKGALTQGTAEQKLKAMLNLPMLQERLTRCSFIISKKEALPELPDKITSVRECELRGKGKKIYKDLNATMRAAIADDLEKAEQADGRTRQILIQNALNKTLKLTTVTSGFIKWDAIVNPIDGTVVQPEFVEYLDDNPKLDLLMEELAELGEHEKAIVWCCQVPMLHRLYEHVKTHTNLNPRLFYGETDRDDRLEATYAFNDMRLVDNPSAKWNDPGVCRVMFANQSAASAGVNWIGYPPGYPELSPYNACKIYYYSKDFSYLNDAQSSDRSHRIGARVPVDVRTLLASRTADVHVHRVVSAKASLATSVNDVREILADMMEL